MKPIFTTSTSLQLRLFLAVIASFSLIIFDSKFDSFSNVRLYLNTAVSPLIYAANIPSEMLKGVSNTVVSRRDLRKKVAEQKDKLFIQQVQLLEFKHLKQENKRLRALLNSPVHSDQRKLVAEIMTVNTDPLSLQVVINKGASDGLYIGQPVLNEQGVVGQIVDVAATYSRILLIADITHGIPVRVQRNDIRAIANGSGELNSLNLPYVPHSTDMQVGDVLVTSGLGGVFPEGYPVATISAFTYQTGQPYAQVEAKPAVELERIRYVLLTWDEGNMSNNNAEQSDKVEVL
ncbi:rod shape-determining protein MreC [Moritella yayanosii]|uniref:Cell shape-determining protein MreC n=1 Tax=Moritella yayanosii TaxID=69539 RepID=A0A330LV46_9GAMM|nr:rod shape-determining protein MreC [Moritella yayanosii]SQD79688.1 putative cell shape-determining protein MreC [Moritella yayanosii]